METHPNPSFFLWKETITTDIMNDLDNILEKSSCQPSIILASLNLIEPGEGVIAHHPMHEGLTP